MKGTCLKFKRVHISRKLVILKCFDGRKHLASRGLREPVVTQKEERLCPSRQFSVISFVYIGKFLIGFQII